MMDFVGKHNISRVEEDVLVRFLKMYNIKVFIQRLRAIAVKS